MCRSPGSGAQGRAVGVAGRWQAALGAQGDAPGRSRKKAVCFPIRIRTAHNHPSPCPLSEERAWGVRSAVPVRQAESDVGRAAMRTG